MTFAAMIGLNILLGMVMPYVSIRTLIVRPIQFRRRYGRWFKNEREKLKSKVATPFAAFFLLVFLGTISAISWDEALPYWRDLPSVVFQKYEVEKGMIKDIEWEPDSYRSWGFDYAVLNGERYPFESLELDSIGSDEMVAFHYLKHTKYLMKVSDQKGNIIKHSFSFRSFLIKLPAYFSLIALFYWISRRRKIFGGKFSARNIPLAISFHTFSICIIVLSCYTGKVKYFLFVMLVHCFMHYFLARGGIKKHVA